MADVNQQVLDALNAGYGPEDILAHMHKTAQDSPAHAAWINNLQRQTLDVRSQQNEPDTTPDYTKPDDQRAALEAQRNALANPTQNPGGQGIKANPSALQQFSTDVGNWYQNTSKLQKGVDVAEYIGGPLAIGYGIKEGIRRGAAILAPTPGEKAAQEQNRISQANLDLERQKLAMKGTEAPAGPSDYELARIETERAKAEQIRASIASQAKRDELAAAKLEQQARPKLSVEEQRLATLAEQQAQAKAATAAGAQPPAPVVEPTNPKLPALLQAPANAPAAAAATPPENMPKKAWEPPTASLAVSAPATPTQAAATTATETPVSKTTLEQQVKAVKEAATPIATPDKQPPTKAPPKPKIDMPEGWGKGMSWLTTVHGVEGAQAFVDQYNNGKPFATHKEMEDKYREVTIRPKYSDIPKDLRRERNIPLRSDLKAVPPPSLRPSDIGQGGGSLIRSLTDPLQLKQ